MASTTTSKDSSNNEKRKKVLLLTGACNGIGKAIVKEFYKSDYNIMINDVQPEELKEIAENTSKVISKNSNDTKIAYFFGDISQQEMSRSLIEETFKKFGSIDILINNISTPGISVIGKTTSNYVESETTNYFTLEEYGISDRNLKGAYLCIRELVQYIINNKNKAVGNEKNINDMKTKPFSIINISCPFDSISDDMLYKGTISQSGIDPFTSSRSGIKTLTKTIALQLANIGIRVNAIAPGIISTDIHKDAKEGNQKDISKIIPFNRLGTPEEIAHVALFLSTNSASYITGTLIYVDGGLNLLHPNYYLESHLERD
ncbi:MAG TPA: SDR family oxidoreductase [Nitrososphaeraceae archaeon]|nr:SDR family oxidoreductase [Nitrososphaeraceae archaeon]